MHGGELRPVTGTDLVEPSRLNCRLVILTVVAALGGFLFGYDTGIISGALTYVKDYLSITKSLPQELIVSGATAGSILGALSSAFWNKRWGRWWSIMGSSVVFITGAMIMAFSESLEMVIGGRLVVGLGIGVASSTVPMYISECAPPNYRGRLVSIFAVMVVFGQACAFGIAYLLSADAVRGWRFMLGLGAVPALLQAIGLCFLPESPRWLINNGKKEQGRLVLTSLRTNSVDVEFRSIVDMAKVDANTTTNFAQTLVRIIRTPSTRRMLFVGCGLQFFQQMIGVNTVMYYSAQILDDAGFSGRKALLGSFLVAYVGAISSLVGMWAVDRVGRRPLLLFSTAGTIVFLGVLSASFYLSMGWLSIVGEALFILAFQMGLGSIPWTVNSEIFPTWARGVGTGASTLVNWSFNLFVALTFLSQKDLLGSYGAVFLLYAGFAATAFLFFFTFLPETKGKTLEEIESLFVAASGEYAPIQAETDFDSDEASSPNSSSDE